MNGYWQTALQERMSRRRALIGASGLGLGASLLAACGGKTSGGGTKQAASGLLVPMTDETKQAKMGGVYKTAGNFELVHLDPQVTGNHVGPAPAMYSQLFRFKDGYQVPTNGDIEGDLIKSFEFSPDKLTLTMKVNTRVQWHPIAPVNARNLDADDIVASWTRFKQTGTRATELANDKNPDAPIVSLTNPDKETVVIKLNAPVSTFLSSTIATSPGTFYIVPKEALDAKVLDLRTRPIGTGPWMLREWKGGQGIFYDRHPHFNQDSRSGLPYMAGNDEYLLPEPAAALAQFTTGALHTYAVRSDDVLSTKQQIPSLEVQASPPTSSFARTFFGQTRTSPFRDVRLRQAWVATWDRDLFIDAYYNVSKFASQGLPLETRWDTALPNTAWSGWWLDPLGKDFGPTAKYYKHDLTAAKQLVSAAGFPNGVDTVMHYPQRGAGSGYPITWYSMWDIVTGMVRDSGLFRWSVDEVNYAADWTPRFRSGKGQFEGVAGILDTAPVDPTASLVTCYTPGGGLYQGGDDTFNDLLGKANLEFDTEKRRALVWEVQRHEAEVEFFPKIGGAGGFTLAWPSLRNRNVWQGGTGRNNATFWLDQTKAPFTKT